MLTASGLGVWARNRSCSSSYMTAIFFSKTAAPSIIFPADTTDWPEYRLKRSRRFELRVVRGIQTTSFVVHQIVSFSFCGWKSAGCVVFLMRCPGPPHFLTPAHSTQHAGYLTKIPYAPRVMSTKMSPGLPSTSRGGPQPRNWE